MSSRNLLLDAYKRLRDETLSARISLDFVDEISEQLKGATVGHHWIEIVWTLGNNAAITLSRIVDAKKGTGSLVQLLSRLTSNRCKNKALWNSIIEHYDELMIKQIERLAGEVANEIRESRIVNELKTYRHECLAHMGASVSDNKAPLGSITFGQIRAAMEHIEGWMNQIAEPIDHHFFCYSSPYQPALGYELSCLKIGLQYESTLSEVFQDLPHNFIESPEDQWPPQRALHALAEFYRNGN